MFNPAPTVSLRDSLFYNFVHVIPYYTRGIFSRSRFWVGLWAKIHPDPMGVRFVQSLRQKYQSDYVYIYMLTTKSLLVLDAAGIKRVLDNSPAIYADARLKRIGMTHFQPDAVTISRGEAWQDRRRFNAAVLDSGQGLHQFADPFLAVIRREIVPGFGMAGQDLTWAEFEKLFERITMQIIFGQRENDPTLTHALKQMMRESNRVFALRKSKYFDGFYQKIRQYLGLAPDKSLVGLCPHAPATANTRVENQIPHWMFAMKDTLAENIVPALALILAHPWAEARVRKEMASVDLASAQGIHSLKYLEGCVQEAMRLWPTTPMLVRETVTADTLGKVAVPPKTQVLILNNFNHRDSTAHAFANHFSPEIWLDGKPNYAFNHLSNGSQICAGKELALFITKAVLATLLSQSDYKLKQPVFPFNQPLPYAFNYFAAVFHQ